jgi:hypothetical protein
MQIYFTQDAFYSARNSGRRGKVGKKGEGLREKG